MTDRNEPYIIDCDPGKKAICTCGRSENLPLCDGSHKGSDDRPTIIEVETAKKVAICGCGKTSNAPYCDGSHSRC